ncbi:hypothetical protein FKW77_007624 [Venturia effusa]|uniref:Zn(2)-C6 fungal-type domain-containing protein n=1 Tax=Venturia effusa TaxID=50376 RepID=A0A517KWV1_9PEZI|nr:hypothetical protein FKW77_007624 [Venturia effusa]
MVGVAGRSKGCLTCKARKKGCDQTRPHCGQCQRSNLVCQGYQDALTFVMYQKAVNKSVRSSVSPGAIVVGPKSKSKSPSPPNSIASFHLNNYAFEDQLFYQYWDHYYPQIARSPLRRPHSNTELGSWQVAIRDQCLDDRIVRNALSALANGSMHRNSEDGRFKYAAIEAYARTLRDLNTALQGDYQAVSDSVLATCKLLATFEVSGGAGAPSFKNYERHIEGINRIMLLRGPLSHSSYLAHSLFLDARYQSMIVAMRKREPCPFDSPEWLTLPWLHRTKDVKDQLIDLMIRVPGLISEFDDITMQRPPIKDTPESRRNFFRRARLLQDALETWTVMLKESTDPELLRATEDGIPHSFDLDNMFLAHTRVLHWTLLLRFYELITIACNKIPVEGAAVTIDDTMFEFNPVPYALKIAKSVGYFYQEGGGLVLAQSVSFSLGSTTLYFSRGNLRDSVEARAIWDSLKAGKTGKMVRQFLISARNHDQATRGPQIEYKPYASDDPIVKP